MTRIALGVIAAVGDGPFGFDSAIFAVAARVKRIDSPVPRDTHLFLDARPEAARSNHDSGGYTGLVLGATVPVVLNLAGGLSAVASSVGGVGNGDEPARAWLGEANRVGATLISAPNDKSKVGGSAPNSSTSAPGG